MFLKYPIMSSIGIALASTCFWFADQAQAQGYRALKPPKELPPAEYNRPQYIDSDGCVFMRAGVGAQTVWVARVDDKRNQICDATSAALEIRQTQTKNVAAHLQQTTLPKSKKSAPSPKISVERKNPPAIQVVAKSSSSKAALIQREVSTSNRVCPSSRPILGIATLDIGSKIIVCTDDTGNILSATLPRIFKNNGTSLAFPTNAQLIDTLKTISGEERFRVNISAETVSLEKNVAKPEKIAPDKLDHGLGSYIQVAIFANSENAKKAENKITQLGLPINRTDISFKNKPAQRISVGPIESQSALKDAQEKLISNGFKGTFIY